MIASHEHDYQWTEDPAFLRDFSQKVAWPNDSLAQLSGLTRCTTCGDTNLVNWTRPLGVAEISSALVARLEGYALAQDVSPSGFWANRR